MPSPTDSVPPINRSRPASRPSSADRAAGPRGMVGRRSATLLVFLHRLPRWVLLAAVFALLAVGMIGTGWLGASALLVLAVLLTWFAYLNWPTLGTSGRLLRIIGVGGLVLFAAGHLLNS